jgi:hypothetical protein
MKDRGPNKVLKRLVKRGPFIPIINKHVLRNAVGQEEIEDEDGHEVVVAEENDESDHGINMDDINNEMQVDHVNVDVQQDDAMNTSTISNATFQNRSDTGSGKNNYLIILCTSIFMSIFLFSRQLST